MAKKAKKELTYEQRVDKATKSWIRASKKYGISMRPYIRFPKDVPRLSVLAMKIINKQGGRFDLEYVDTQK